MRHAITTVTLLVVWVGSTPTFAARPAARGTEAASDAAPPQTASHAIRGVVRSVGATSLVIARPGKNQSGDLVFILNASTLRAGPIAVGSTVSVRYHIEGQGLVATAVTGRQAARVTRTPGPGAR